MEGSRPPIGTVAFVLRFYGFIIAATSFSAALGGLIGTLLYKAIYRSDNGTFLDGLFEVLLGIAVGALVALVTYWIATKKLARRMLRERATKGALWRIALAPLLAAVCSYAIPSSTSPWIPVVVGVAIFPIGIRGKMWVAPLVAFLIAALLIRIADFQRQEFDAWTGPLYLINGSTTKVGGNDWFPLNVNAPYDNSSSSGITLQSRRVNADQSESNFVVQMKTGNLADGVCPFPASCTDIGPTKFGLLKRSSSTGDFYVEVPKGYIRISDGNPDGLDTVAILESLQEVDAETFESVVAEQNRA